MDKQSNIDELLNTFSKIKRAVPNERFLLKMENMAAAYVSKQRQFSKASIFGIAASLLLLIAFNFTILNASEESGEEIQVELSDNSEYNLLPTKSIYNE